MLMPICRAASAGQKQQQGSSGIKVGKQASQHCDACSRSSLTLVTGVVTKLREWRITPSSLASRLVNGVLSCIELKFEHADRGGYFMSLGQPSTDDSLPDQLLVEWQHLVDSPIQEGSL